MASNSVLSKLTSWLRSPEVFGNVSKRFPGEWKLFEYYVDENDDLIHMTADDLKINAQDLKLKFTESGNFHCLGDLPVSIFHNLETGKWNRARNFITLVDPSEYRNSVEFQFAFEKGNLKLLKRDALGKIAFFGFFKPVVIK